MVNEEMLSYIEDSRRKGYSTEEISVALRNAGWTDSDITTGLQGETVQQEAPAGSPLAVPIIDREPVTNFSGQPISNPDLALIKRELKREAGGIDMQAIKKENPLIAYLLTNNLAASKLSAQVTIGAVLLLICVGIYLVFM